jgi:hypothetical protein
MTAAARIPWHPPLIVEHIVLSPPAAQLTLSSRRSTLRRTDREHEAELNRVRQDRWRERQYDNPRTCYIVEGDGDMLNALVRWGRILDHEAGDPKIVGKAIGEVMAELVRNDPLKPPRW